MKFVCLGYLDPAKMDARPKEEIDAVMQACQPHLERFYNSGRVVIDAGLSPDTKCLRRQNEKVIVTDGPFVESKEMIGSVFLIEARDMEEAVEIASLHPTTQIASGEQFGWRVEIRPIHYYKPFESKL
ncbi:YciI family protein [Paenibacillus humicola]|uniref:YciI family protein n=1 Tax=Paenibacillus humicola TaxID=3110540 RepID=UPI00237A81BC|nr:YciI family protein [Paenibacillus humicola]